MILLVLTLIVLHGADQREIDVNPTEITSLREGSDSQHFTKGLRCLVNLSDGKFVAVLESCAAIRMMIAKIEERTR
jgi:hypothetical protein